MTNDEVTAEEMAQDSNDQCHICMDSFVEGSRAMKLPCGRE